MKICLQGGAEFGRNCRDMDKAVLRRAGGGPVAILPLAVPPQEYGAVGRQGVAWYASLGATGAASLGVSGVTVAPDPREDPAGASDVLSSAKLIVVPGGSPSSLLADLRATGMDEVLAAALADGAVVSGSSAGGMVLCETFFDPGPGADEAGLQPGLGWVPRCVLLPHYVSGLRPEWLARVPEGVSVLGVGECSGALVAGDRLTALGTHRTRVIEGGRPVAVLDPGTTRDPWR